MDKQPKYSWSQLPNEAFIDALRSFEEWRRRVNSEGINDNAGAIHSAERLAELLSLKIAYPGLSHINELRNYDGAKFSKKAWAAFKKGEKVEIEHVSPKRAYTIALLSALSKTNDKNKIKKWIRKNFKLILLTTSERVNLDRVNRIRMCPDRLSGIVMRQRRANEHRRLG